MTAITEIDRMGFSTFHCTLNVLHIHTHAPAQQRVCLCICSAYTIYELEAAGNFIVQFKNDYVKLGSIVECFLHLHSY